MEPGDGNLSTPSAIAPATAPIAEPIEPIASMKSICCNFLVELHDDVIR
jgi:hypothetical protein